MYATRKEIAQLIQRTIKTADDAKFKNVHALSSHETIASHTDVLWGSSCEPLRTSAWEANETTTIKGLLQLNCLTVAKALRSIVNHPFCEVFFFRENYSETFLFCDLDERWHHLHGTVRASCMLTVVY